MPKSDQEAFQSGPKKEQLEILVEVDQFDVLQNKKISMQARIENEHIEDTIKSAIWPLLLGIHVVNNRITLPEWHFLIRRDRIDFLRRNYGIGHVIGLGLQAKALPDLKVSEWKGGLGCSSP